MQLDELKPEFDRLQKKHGGRKLRAIYGAGCVARPRLCFVFMNPTGRNVAADSAWAGLRAPWLGTKNIWKLFVSLGLLDRDLYRLIRARRPEEWNPAFAGRVYRNLADHGVYVTNLSKATQNDARHLPDAVFREYLPLMRREIAALRPRVIVTLGNQVSSILLGRPVKVSECRKTPSTLCVKGRTYPVYSVYYPVGQGLRNLPMAVADIRRIINGKNDRPRRQVRVTR